jgi:cation diffusion facilitator family transporter
MNKETLRTVVVAGVANLVIALAKLAAGLVTGSSAMLAEAAHSVADTVNQGFLLVSLRTGARPADEEFPFGHGQERYFWSLLAAVGIFVAGAGFSVFEGVLSIVTGQETTSVTIAYVVLAVSLVAEGTSLTRAVFQVHGEARQRRRGLLDHVRRSRDTTVKAALFEDTAAVVGLVIAAAGLSLEALTGSPVWDGGASILIGLLLVVVAFRLGSDSKDGLIGQAADPDELRLIRQEI